MKTLAVLTPALLCCAAFAQPEATETFDTGPAGWSISGRETIDQAGGNPGANMHCILDDVFGADIRTDTARLYLGDLTVGGGPLTLSVDVKVNSIIFFDREVPRTLIVELRDYVEGPYPWVSVWHTLGELTSERPGWIRYQVTIDDPSSAVLPAGWGGTGDEDPVTYEPRLPPNRTFASVLRNVDELTFTTFVPGYFYGGTYFDIQADNIHIGREALPPRCMACVADYNEDGGVDGGDVEAFFSAWADSEMCADANQDGGIDGADVEAFFGAWEAGGCD